MHERRQRQPFGMTNCTCQWRESYEVAAPRELEVPFSNDMART